MTRLVAKWLSRAALLFACCASGMAATQATSTPAALYARGLECYRAATPDQAGARRCWTEALDPALGANRAQRAQLCKSLGNSAFRQERPLEAAAWFSAAVALSPRDADAWSNLEFARSKAGLEPADRGDLSATFERLSHYLTLAESEWLALAMAALLAGGIVLRAFVLGAAASSRPLALLLVLTLIALVPWLVQSGEVARDPVFVISTAGVPVTSEPRPAASKVALLAAGAQARRLEELAGWVRVETRAGERGWVPADAVFALRR